MYYISVIVNNNTVVEIHLQVTVNGRLWILKNFGILKLYEYSIFV